MSLAIFVHSVVSRHVTPYRWRLVVLFLMFVQANFIIMSTLHLYRNRSEQDAAGNASSASAGTAHGRLYYDVTQTNLNTTVSKFIPHSVTTTRPRDTESSTSPSPHTSSKSIIIASTHPPSRPSPGTTQPVSATTSSLATMNKKLDKSKTSASPVKNVPGCAEKIAEFMEHHKRTCERTMVPGGTNTGNQGNRSRSSLPLCPCIPPALTGVVDLTFAKPHIGEIELKHPELEKGGRWRPPGCISRQKVAFIIPFRDRQEHLRIFLNHIHPILQRQQLDYTIFVVEQKTAAVFNKAMLMNIGFVEAMKLYDFDCFIFHDVDMLPEDDRNLYTCSETPRHAAPYLRKWKYILPYGGIFGGAIALKPHHFKSINGFSNKFVGWGGEDDDMFRRVKAGKLKVVRYPPCVARYTMIKHKHDRGNPYNRNSGKAWKYRPKEYRRDGLNSLRYSGVEVERRPLYTWLYASVEQSSRFAWFVHNSSTRLISDLVLVYSGFLWTLLNISSRRFWR